MRWMWSIGASYDRTTCRVPKWVKCLEEFGFRKDVRQSSGENWPTSAAEGCFDNLIFLFAPFLSEIQQIGVASEGQEGTHIATVVGLWGEELYANDGDDHRWQMQRKAVRWRLWAWQVVTFHSLHVATMNKWLCEALDRHCMNRSGLVRIALVPWIRFQCCSGEVLYSDRG